MSMIENIFKLKHKAVEKIVKYSNQMSLRTKIRQGYIVMTVSYTHLPIAAHRERPDGILRRLSSYKDKVRNVIFAW